MTHFSLNCLASRIFRYRSRLCFWNSGTNSNPSCQKPAQPSEVKSPARTTTSGLWRSTSLSQPFHRPMSERVKIFTSALSALRWSGKRNLTMAYSYTVDKDLEHIFIQIRAPPRMKLRHYPQVG